MKICEEEKTKEETNGEDKGKENEVEGEENNIEKDFEDKIKNDKLFEIKNFLTKNKSIKIWNFKTSEKDDSTILHCAIIKNNTKIIKEIIRYCKKNLSKEELKNFINKKNNAGITALHYASFKGNIDVIQKLIVYGADISALTKKKLNVLDFACQGNKPNSLVYFDYYHKNKIDLNELDERKSNTLHWACYSSSYECVEFLLEKGVSINTQDQEGFTPLHLAVIAGIGKIVRLLLQKGALTNIRNKKGETPIELASKKKRIEIYKILKSNSKCTFCNCRAPTKKIEKSKKYIYIGIIYKIITSFILLSNISPFLFNNTCYEKINLISFLVYFILNLIYGIIYIYLICSNPGYINKNDKITDIESLLFQQKNDFKMYCFKCQVFKTDTLKHCSICNLCCKEFDHHCFWLNNCIGKNNYISFICLLYMCFIDILFMNLISIYSILIRYKIFLEQNSNCENNDIFGSIYNKVKEILSYIEIKINSIPEITSTLILLSINIFLLFPLIYLINIHTKACKNKRKEKGNIRKIDLSFPNNNQDQLLERNSENETSIDSDI